MKKLLNYFTATEKLLWGVSVALILISFILFDKESYLTLSASLVGVTSLIFNAKGNPIGQLLMVVFSVLYGIISFEFSYYGEMITYLGMTAPMALVALITWLKHPYKGNKAEVVIYKIKKKDVIFAVISSAIVTAVFYFILVACNTANIAPSTLSITTSYVAAYLTYKRSPYFALAYAANDVVLILLWILAAFENISYISVIICFAVFLVNDIYGYISWKKMQIRQK